MGESDWRDRQVLVTGASGLLGGWLVRKLLEEGAEVTCLVRDWVPRSPLLAGEARRRINLVRGDVGERELLERILGEYAIDTVFHLAAQTIVGVANDMPGPTFETNIRGTWQLLEAVRRAGRVSAVVVASSDKAYGTQEVLPYTEETPLRGRHPYDVSKSCVDLIAQAYAATYGLPVAITRCGNLYGGGDLHWDRLIPGTIRALLAGRRPVLRSDGRHLRDYLYVEDGVAAYLALAAALRADETFRGAAFNFADDAPVTALEVVRQLTALTGRDVQPEILDEARGEIPLQSLASGKARAQLGWAPNYTLDAGLREAVHWYADFLGVAPPRSLGVLAATGGRE